MRKPRLVSLFSGVGGIDAGFHAAGFSTVFATDIWDKACESFSLNFPDTEVSAKSIEQVDFGRVLKRYGEIDGLVGGPPCPSFSKSRFYRKELDRGISDATGHLTVSNYFRALKVLRPKFFFFENVHGFIYKPHKASLDYVTEESVRLGYNITHRVVNSADYGVPQTRERFICIGVRNDLPSFVYPEPTHAEEPSGAMLPWVTAGDVLSDVDFDLPEDVSMQAGSKHKDLLKLVPPGDNYLFFTTERGHPQPQFKWRSRYWSFLLKLSPHRPSWTIQASHSNNMGPFHWKNRFLRISEIKRLQSFPDEFSVLGSFREQWRQIGNAVPPKLAYQFAQSIRLQYFKR